MMKQGLKVSTGPTVLYMSKSKILWLQIHESLFWHHVACIIVVKAKSNLTGSEAKNNFFNFF